MSDKPILLICGCEKYEIYLYAAILRFASPDVHFVGFKGSLTISEPVYDAVNHVVTLPVPDTYEALPTKIHAAFSWAATMWPNAPGIFKTDDDILLFNKEDLLYRINKYKEEPYWGFITHHCAAEKVPDWRIQTRFTDKALCPSYPEARYCFGAGYWVSKAALTHILAAKDVYESSCVEDICTGYVLNRQGIRPVQHQIIWRECPRVPELLKQ